MVTPGFSRQVIEEIGYMDPEPSIAAVMVEKQGVQAAPDTGTLSDTLMRMKDIVTPHVRAPGAEGCSGNNKAGLAEGCKHADRSAGG